jgi:hypothetical protein
VCVVAAVAGGVGEEGATGTAVNKTASAWRETAFGKRWKEKERKGCFDAGRLVKVAMPSLSSERK